MRAMLGQTVLFTIAEHEDDVNGSRTFPAIVTAVHSDELVNLRVFLDSVASLDDGEWRTSVGYRDQFGVPYTWSHLSAQNRLVDEPTSEEQIDPPADAEVETEPSDHRGSGPT